MKGIISGLKRMEIHDGDGLRTTVFFKGCPLKCIWCHNPESLSPKPQIAFFKEKCIECGICSQACNESAIVRGNILRESCTDCGICAEACPTEALNLYGEEIDAEKLIDRLMVDAPFWRNGNGGVTLSGGECLMQPDFAIALASSLHAKGISIDIDTCGFAPQWVFDAILPYTDTFLYDIKAISDTLHRKCTGVSNALILSNLRHLSDKDSKIDIPLVKGYNDGEIPSIGDFLSGINGVKMVKVLKYHSFSASRYTALGIPCRLPDALTAQNDIDNAVNTLRSFGLNAVSG